MLNWGFFQNTYLRVSNNIAIEKGVLINVRFDFPYTNIYFDVP